MTANSVTDGSEIRCHDEQEIEKWKSKYATGRSPMRREESRFEQNLAVAASYLKCAYIKIPDPIYDRKRADARKAGKDTKSRRRPFDGILVIKEDEDHWGGIYACEAKYGNNRLEPHQLANLTLVNRINGMGYIIRMKRLKDKTEYTVEWPEKNVLFETGNLIDFIGWFRNLSLIKK